EAFASLCCITIVEYRRHRVEVLAAVAPQVDAAVGDDTGRMVVAGEPVHGVYLMDHPLVRDARGIWPEQPELEMLSGIKWLKWPVDQESLPIGILLLEQRYYFGTPPTAGLVHVPGHVCRHYIAEFSRFDEVVSCHVAGSRAPLSPDLDDFL